MYSFSFLIRVYLSLSKFSLSSSVNKRSTCYFFSIFFHSLFVLGDPLLFFIANDFMKFLDLLILFSEPLSCLFCQIVDFLIELTLHLCDLMFELVLEGQQCVISPFGFVGDELLAVLYFPESDQGYLSMSMKRASSCFFHSSLFFFMNSKSSPIWLSCLRRSSDLCLSYSTVDLDAIWL